MSVTLTVEDENGEPVESVDVVTVETPSGESTTTPVCLNDPKAIKTICQYLFCSVGNAYCNITTYCISNICSCW